jgi:GT2 family glycosyltransferase/glycosyltransferase involved in cell wall biosynthesis
MLRSRAARNRLMSRLQSLKPRPRGGSGRKGASPAAAATPRATLSFRGTVALCTFTPPMAPAGVRYDGVPLPADRWRITDDGVVEITCPPTAFDTAPHRLQLDWAMPGPASLELPFRSQYHAGIESADDVCIRGWIYDTLRPTSQIALDVASGGNLWQVRNSLARPELQAKMPGLLGGGFEIALPPRPADSAPELLTITVAGTLHQPFGPILRGATLPAAVAVAAAAGRGLGRSPAARLFGTALLPALLQAVAAQARPNVVQLKGTQFLPRPDAPEIDVIVPVYRGAAETLACLQSIFDGNNRVRHRVVVIDDCSPEPALSAALRELADAGRIHLLRNEANLGFVASVNRGMAQSDSADVLLLNADTILPAGGLDRLYRAACSDTAIATVTPLSNNATAYSLPAPPGDPADPWGLRTDEIDAICCEVNAAVVRDIPTAHGFCMFIRRAALDDVGLFDAASFGTGYGEENDFSLRALLRGWRNVCAADVYVRHVGTVSFTASAVRDAQLAANLRVVQARYPFYAALIADFLRTDPLHDVRNNVQKAIWRRHARITVFITLALDGGAARHGRDMMARLTGEGWLVLALTTESDDEGARRLVLRRADRAEALRYPAAAPLEEALADILDLAPRFLHVQHLIDLPDGIAEFVRDCGIPYAVTLHDFFYACPKVTLLDAGSAYCGMPPASRCTHCVRQGPIHPQIHPSLAAYSERGEIWRGKWDGLLREATQVIAPSHDTAARYAQLFPGLGVSVRPHFAPPDLRPPPRILPRAPDPHLQVALPGAIGPQKGIHGLIELARHCSRWHEDIRFVIVGYSDREEELRRYDNIQERGGYRPEDAVATLAASGCRVALLLSVFPETFSYTLSEILQAGLVPVAYDFGAVGERMRALGVGVTVPPGASPEQLVAAIRQAAAMRVTVPPAALYGQYATLMGDYYAAALCDLAEAAPPPDLPCILGAPRGLHDDGWCDGVLTLRLWSARRIERIALDLWVPPEGRFQVVEITCDGAKLLRRFIDEGDGRRIVCPLPDSERRLREITCTFDFTFRLQPPDIRACAAMLSAVQVNDGGGWLAVELPDAAGRASARRAGTTA